MRPRPRRLAPAALVAALAAAAPIHAQQHPVVWTSQVDGAARARPGDTLKVRVSATIPPGWHVYSLTQAPGGPVRMTLGIAGPADVARLAGQIHGTVPIVADDPNFGIQTETYEGAASFSVPVAILPTAAIGSRRVDVVVGYEACNARYCLPPTSDTLATAVTVATSADVAAGAGSGAAAAPAPVSEQGASSESLALFLWLAATMGALSLLTPCVFPMVPITISYFSGRGAGHRGQAVRDALVYGVGIIGAFTGFGIGLALVFGAAGLNRFAANAWLNLGIGALFAAFALSLFGAFDLALPSGVLTRLDALSRRTSLHRDVATLLMGATFALTSFTCTAPFVGTLLVSITQGSVWWPVAGLLIFSSVFALPFLVLALVPAALGALPRGGDWMVTLKGTLAFVELAAAVKFISNADLVEGWGVVTRPVVIASWVVLGLGLAAYLFGVRRRRAPNRLVRAHPAAAGIVLVLTGWLSLGLAVSNGGGRSGGAGVPGELPWILDDYDAALAAARAQGKLVFIDFTGYTCTNCRWMEANMFPRDPVRGALERFVRVRLFTDGDDARDRGQSRFQLQTFRTSALPLYAIVDSLGRPVATFLGMTRSTNEFVRFLVSGSEVP